MRGNIPIKWKSEYTQFYEPGKDVLYTKNTVKTNKDSGVLTAVDDDADDIFKD